MSDDDLEPRLRAMLTGRADRVPDAAADGPTLRARARTQTHATRRTVAQSLVAAAVVAVIAVVTQVLPHDRHRPAPAPVQPGGATSTPYVPPVPASATRAEPTRSSAPPDPTPSSTRPAPTRRSTARPTAPTRSVAPTRPTSTAATPSSLTLRPPPRATTTPRLVRSVSLRTP